MPSNFKVCFEKPWLVRNLDKSTTMTTQFTVAAKAARKKRRCFQNESASSIMNKTPPIGEPNADETPHAHPTATNSAFSASVDKNLYSLARGRAFWRIDAPKICSSDRPCATTAPTTAPTWTMGPSLPHSKPPATAHTMPTTFAASVVSVMTAGCGDTPFKYVLISGMPEPLALGAPTTANDATRPSPRLTAHRNPHAAP
mmetsp:Transcript_19982/g.79700  ORF Transcript_19982/g.79700 Transcript_19982/m.79700 type:complete len:200 (+) Transcript_19982:328-927(+)